MFVVRPVELADIPALEAMWASGAETVHTMPRGREAIAEAVERSIDAFASPVDFPGEEHYLFVLEQLQDGAGALAGSAAMAAVAGSSGMFFAFRNDVIQQVSRDLKIRHSVHVLTLSSDLTGHSQLLSFCLRAPRQAGDEAALLSRARLLFAASQPQRFSDKFFSSMPGVNDRLGESPFWDAIGRKFFQMSLLEVERAIQGARDRTLLVELMPHYPVYVPMLPGAARAAMGQVHVAGELPLRLLSAEGFEPDNFIDIFDGGAILQAHRMALRSYSSSVPRQVGAAPAGAGAGAQSYLVGSTGRAPFRAVLVQCAPLGLGDAMPLPEAARRALDVAAGDSVLTVKL